MIKIGLAVVCAAALWAQEPNPTQRAPQQPNVVQSGTAEAPIFSITVVRRTTQAVNYRHRSGSTEVDLRGTELMPQARGKARVNSKQGRLEIDADMGRMQPPATYGPEYLTYVLWAVSPEGRAQNLGEVLLSQDGKSKLNATTDLQAFGLIVTAEPYFAVTQPSDVVVMENFIRPDTKGQWETVDAKYELLKRGQYALNHTSEVRPAMNPKVPLELYEARNALQIARWAASDRYAADTFSKAQDQLNQAEAYLARKAGEKPTVMMARAAVETAEDARIISLRKQRQEQIAREKQEAADREAAARAKAEEETLQRQAAEKRRAQAESERAAAEQAKAEAQAATQQAVQERAAANEARAQAEAARQAALAEQQRLANETQQAQNQAQEAERARQAAVADRDRIRQELLQQLNMVLETRETARGLIVNMSDVLFDFGKATLKPAAREKLAKIAGIVLAHPGLVLEVEGHTDSIGSEEYNQKLSEARANTVRDFLVDQGLKSDAVSARGFGKSQPVASNSTAAGRQQNRRVEMVVSGDVIGTKIQSMKMQAQPGAPDTTQEQTPAQTPPQR